MLPDHFWAKVDKTGDCWQWLGYTNAKGYGRTGINQGHGKKILVHRLVYTALVGPILEGLVIDHLCHNPACCNPAHLEAVTNQKNVARRKGAQVNSKTGVRGVHWREDAQKYRVLVESKGQTFHGGYFSNLDEADKAAQSLRAELFI